MGVWPGRQFKFLRISSGRAVGADEQDDTIVGLSAASQVDRTVVSYLPFCYDLFSKQISHNCPTFSFVVAKTLAQELVGERNVAVHVETRDCDAKNSTHVAQKGRRVRAKQVVRQRLQQQTSVQDETHLNNNNNKNLLYLNSNYIEKFTNVEM